MPTLNVSEDIQSLTDFKRNTAEFIEQLAATGRPLALTVNGQAKVVVQDAAAYQKLLERAEQLELIEGLRASLESMRQGKGRPAREFFEELRQKHNLPPRRP